ncbi:hypothetical protein CDEST_15311 [Colletotrichum destructivum]|uniref:Uncharacterized protein n=1 Tax=Colletotrichum destructivum TaxID=34406 RepID=A0AAX4J4I4_9PEZI|nr:hypothetical protein CDEST_15311 [Colletotrichum destructivum]
MRLAAIFSTALAASAGVSAAPLEPRSSFVQVPLPAPQNWAAGGSLFPGQIIAAYHADAKDYTADTWSAYVLEKCKGYTACTSSLSYSAINSGSTGGRFWFGFVFRGGATTVADYERVEEAESGVTDSIAYTITSL